eukprot:gene14085-16651_t
MVFFSALARREAWVMMVTDEHSVKPHRLTYVDSACLLIYGLRKAGTTREILVMVEPTISSKRRKQLETLNVTLLQVDRRLPPKDYRQDWGKGDLKRQQYAFTKLYAFSLVEYTKVVYVDVDMLVMPGCHDIDAIFGYQAPAAALEYGTTDNTYQSGMLVIAPSKELYVDLQEQHYKVCDYPQH